MRRDFLASSRKLRRKRLILKAVFVAIIFMAVFAGIVAFFRMPYLQVEKIEVEGNSLVDGDGLIEKVKEKLEGKYFGLFPKTNIFIIPKSKILGETPQEIRRIKNITLEKKYFGAIALKIEERSNSALYCKTENCAYADENGFIFEKAPYFSGTVFLKLIDQRSSEKTLARPADGVEDFIGSNLIDESEFKKILEFAGLAVKIGNGTTEVILKNENIYEFYTKEGWKIILNDKNEPKSAYLNLVTALDANIKDKRTKLDYIDLRLGNKIYFKYR